MSTIRLLNTGNTLSTTGQSTGYPMTQKAVTDALNTKVGLSGNQTIGGIKTFSSFPVTPSAAPTADYQVVNKKYVDDALYLQPSMTGSITLNGTTDNTVVMADIVTELALEVGDVIRIDTGAYNKLHTVESITNNSSIIVNYEHAGNRGDGSLKLPDFTGQATVTRIAKWHSASDGLGQAWVDVTRLRPSSMNANVLNSTNRKILVSISSVEYSGRIVFLTARVNGVSISRTVLPNSADPRNLSMLFPAHGGENYAYSSATGTSISLSEWRERR